MVVVATIELSYSGSLIQKSPSVNVIDERERGDSKLTEFILQGCLYFLKLELPPSTNPLVMLLMVLLISYLCHLSMVISSAPTLITTVKQLVLTFSASSSLPLTSPDLTVFN